MPASVGSPMAAANSVTENSAIRGGAGSGDRHPGLAVVPHGGRLVQGVDRVHARPGDRRLQLLGFRTVGRGGPGPRELEHRGGGVEVGGGPCHDPIPAPTTDSQTPKTGFSTGVREAFFATLFKATAVPGSWS